MQTKVCSKCGINKPLTAYCKCDSDKYGVYSICKECVNWGHRSEESKQRETDRWCLLAMGFKICPKCSTRKIVSEFRKQSSRKDGLRAYCIECENKLSKEHDQRPEIKQRRHDRDKLPEVRENRRQYRQTSEKFKATQKKYETSEKRKEGRLRYGKTEMFKLKRTVRNNIYRMVKFGAVVEDAYFLDSLGCSADELKRHLESLWIEGMSWDNYSHKGWHIDHIKPMAMFNLKDPNQFQECAHYTNLQPLWAKENLAKNSLYNGKRRFVKDVS